MERILEQSLALVHTVTYTGLRMTRMEVLDWMIGFIGTSVTMSLNYKPYSAIADLHTFQFTAAHALGLVVAW
jgi:hypothetical protein